MTRQPKKKKEREKKNIRIELVFLLTFCSCMYFANVMILPVGANIEFSVTKEIDLN